jgi:hypothetical protein
MTQKDFDFERDLSDAFASVKMPAGLQQRLQQISQLHPQRQDSKITSWIRRLLPGPWLEGLQVISARPIFGMTTGAAAACCSLVIGLTLGLGGFSPTAATYSTVVASNGTTAPSSTASENDAVAMVYAAADLPGDLP